MAEPTREESSIRLQQAKKLMQQRELPQAIELLKEAVDADVDNPALHEALATAYFLTSELDSALEQFQTVTRLQPSRGAAYVNMGAVYNRQGDFRKALDVLRKGIQREKRSANAYYNLGIAQKGLKQLGMAVTAYKEAIKLKPEMAEAHQNLGNVYLDMQNHRQASHSFAKALELRPNFARAKRGLELAEEGKKKGRVNANPFGRLVNQDDLGNQKKEVACRELTESESYEDRQHVRGSAGVLRDEGREMVAALHDDLLPSILALNRAVLSGGEGTRELAKAYDEFAAAARDAGSKRVSIAEQVKLLREHDKKIRG